MLTLLTAGLGAECGCERWRDGLSGSVWHRQHPPGGSSVTAVDQGPVVTAVLPGLAPGTHHVGEAGVVVGAAVVWAVPVARLHAVSEPLDEAGDAGLPEHDVEPGVEDLVPAGHPHDGQVDLPVSIFTR